MLNGRRNDNALPETLHISAILHAVCGSVFKIVFSSYVDFF